MTSRANERSVPAASASTPQTEASASSSGRVDELLRLSAVDECDMNAVRAALGRRPDVVSLLLDMHAEVASRFGPNAGMDLVPDHDYDHGGDPSVGVFVRPGLRTADARGAFGAFRREWWYPRMRAPEHDIALDCVWR
jgi:hypothetical protein